MMNSWSSAYPSQLFITLPKPVPVLMTIDRVHQEPVHHARSCEVMLVGLSPNCLTMITHLRLPISNHYSLAFTCDFDNDRIFIRGNVVCKERKHEQEHVEYQYTVKFILTPQQKAMLTSRLNIQLTKACPHYSKMMNTYNQGSLYSPDPAWAHVQWFG